MAPWTVKEAGPNVHIIDVEWDARGGEFESLLVSDVHKDHPHCDEKLFKKHMDEALAANSPVISGGDLFCAMQGPNDKRRTIGSIKPEHNQPAYYTALSDGVASDLEKYAPILTVLANGNHETAVVKHSGVDLTRELVSKLRAAGAPHVYAGGYHGFIRFQFRRGNWRQSRDLYYHHGSGGGGYATRGALDVNRMAAQVRADIVWMGHVHYSMHVPVQQIALSGQNRIIEREMLHIKTPGYKTNYLTPFGFEVEKGHGPRPRGGMKLRFWEANDELRFDAVRAA